MESRLQRCADLDAAITALSSEGYRLDMIMPADAPRTAVLSGPGGRIRLELDRPPAPRPDFDPQALLIQRAADAGDVATGRAGMQYRDLVPSRLGGGLIASQIGIPDGGPVADYVHFHHVGFQFIYCQRGWVRVVYEDQGPPFVMQAGDCVLQPPTIRHRVLEASPGLQVIELASPDEHETCRDHALELPTPVRRPDREFGGQRFLHHVAADARWQPVPGSGFECRDTGLATASHGAVDVKVFRTLPERDDRPVVLQVDETIVFLLVLSGQATLQAPTGIVAVLNEGDSCVVPQTETMMLMTSAASELLVVRAPVAVALTE